MPTDDPITVSCQKILATDEGKALEVKAKAKEAGAFGALVGLVYQDLHPKVALDPSKTIEVKPTTTGPTEIRKALMGLVFPPEPLVKRDPPLRPVQKPLMGSTSSMKAELTVKRAVPEVGKTLPEEPPPVPKKS